MADGLARQIAGLAGDITRLGKRIPSYQRGVVANVSPPTVAMDRDVTATPQPVADVLVPGLAVGQRVEVRVIGTRRVITSIHPADGDTGWLPIELQNSWTIHNSRPPQARKIGHTVWLRGQVIGGSGAIATLSSTFRPDLNIIVPVASTGNAYMQIGTNGVLTPNAPGFVSLAASYIVG